MKERTMSSSEKQIPIEKDNEQNVVKICEFLNKDKSKKLKSKTEDFFELMKQNLSNQERLRNERNKANLSVIRTHKLKK